MTKYLFSSTRSNRYLLAILCLVENFFFYLKVNWLNDLIFFHIKKELFYISGQCQNSGVCCRGLGIRFKGSFISDMKRYIDICKENNKFTRFIPHLKRNRISYFYRLI